MFECSIKLLILTKDLKFLSESLYSKAKSSINLSARKYFPDKKQRIKDAASFVSKLKKSLVNKSDFSFEISSLLRPSRLCSDTSTQIKH